MTQAAVLTMRGSAYGGQIGGRAIWANTAEPGTEALAEALARAIISMHGGADKMREELTGEEART